jgi:hypothetical protein
VEATRDAANEQRQRDERARRLAITTQRTNEELTKKLLEGKTLGDGLAASKLPDAIAISDSKIRMLEALGAGASGMDQGLLGRLMSGTATADEATGAGVAAPMALAIRRMHQTEEAHDFVYRNTGGRGVITPIDTQDQLVGMRAGGPIAAAGGRSGGNVIINVNGGDQRQVFETVRRAIVLAGITPNRVPSGGG